MLSRSARTDALYAWYMAASVWLAYHTDVLGLRGDRWVYLAAVMGTGAAIMSTANAWAWGDLRRWDPLRKRMAFVGAAVAACLIQLFLEWVLLR